MHFMQIDNNETIIAIKSKSNGKKTFSLSKMLESYILKYFHIAIRLHLWFSFLLEICLLQQILDSG